MTEYFDLITLLPSIFLIPLLPYLRKHLNWNPQKLSYGAVTSGVLLTFYGIWVGLMGFQFSDIEIGIPALLDGLKMSFGSSIVGLATSMIINLTFVKPEKDDSELIIEALSELSESLENFKKETSEAQLSSLTIALERLVDDLELGINTETQKVMIRFRESVDFLSQWQQNYIEEIKEVTNAMDKNAKVTDTTSRQLDRTNDVLEQLGPLTERLADTVKWIQRAVPSARPRGSVPNKELEEARRNIEGRK